MATTDTEITHTFMRHVLLPRFFLTEGLIDYCAYSAVLDVFLWVFSLAA